MCSPKRTFSGHWGTSALSDNGDYALFTISIMLHLLLLSVAVVVSWVRSFIFGNVYWYFLVLFNKVSKGNNISVFQMRDSIQ